jgi:CHASE2 domain-containing sensor protein
MTVKRIFLNVHAFVVTALVIGVMLFLVWLPINLDFLNLMSETLGDFDIHDIVQSQLYDFAEPDTAIVIVNIGRLPKRLIAEQIERLQAFQPKVIGLDVFPLLPNPRNPEHDSLFSQTLQRYPSIVLASKLDGWNESLQQYDTLALSPPQFSAFAHSGFVNLIIDDNKPYRVVRHCSVCERVGKNEEYAFAAKVAQLYDSLAFNDLLARGNQKEIIHYRGNLKSFYVLDVEDALDSTADLEIVRDKIVLMGFLGDDVSNPFQSIEDRFFTPINERYIGKTDRDMFGVVIHANIVSMIINRRYINEMPEYASYLLTIVFCYFFVVFLEYLDDRFRRYYEVFSLAAQIILAVALLFITLWSFSFFSYNADLTLMLLIVAIGPNTVEIYLTFVPPIISELHFKTHAYSSTNSANRESAERESPL